MGHDPEQPRRGALGIYQAAGAGHYVQIIERNIALTELFLSAESDPDAQLQVERKNTPETRPEETRLEE